MKFYKCSVCGKIIAVIDEKPIPTLCCGKPMDEMIPNTLDGAKEKHLPVIKVEGNKVTVTVGEIAHPMLPEHFIQWIVLKTNKGNQRKLLKPSELPQAIFYIGEDEKVIEALEYCNLHGLYSTKA